MTDQEIIKSLKQACEGFRMCRVHFQKEPYSRLIHPHGIAYTRKREVVIVCFQVAGYSKSQKLPEFRNLMINRCERIEVLNEKFKAHPKFNPLDHQYLDWMFHVE
ncbi:MAG: hypothetical protein ACOYXT_12965 [Bacteroidota bacterium]